ncbi:UNVERIFIED_CONTAM: hypothetical protein FKN15_061994 [Acipenser sinensis]
MLHRTKYNRFRNESVTSVDELLHSLSMNSKVSAAPETSAAPPYPTSAEVLHADQEDAPTTLCTLIHKVSHLKFSGTGSLSGIKNLSSAVKDLAVSKLQGSSSTPSTTAGAVDNTCNPASTPLCSQQDLSKMSTGKKIKLEEMHLGGEDWNQSGSVVNKPSRGWLHSNEKILGPGVTYIVKPPSKALSSILGKSNLQFAGMSITLNISTSSLNLMTPDSKQGIRLNPRWMRCCSSTHTARGNPLRSWLACFTSDRLQYVNQRQTCAPGPNSLKDRQCSEPARRLSSSPRNLLPWAPSQMLKLEEAAWMEEEEESTDHPYYNSIPGKMPPPGGFIDVRMKNQTACPTDGAQPTTMTGRDQTYYQGRHFVENQSDDRKPAPVRQALQNEASPADDDDVNVKWNQIKTAYCQSSEKILGLRKSEDKEWISAATWALIQQRKNIKYKINQTS